jgi:hypothetical protein
MKVRDSQNWFLEERGSKTRRSQEEEKLRKTRN